MAAVDQTRAPSKDPDRSSLALESAAGLCADDVLARLGSTVAEQTL